ncbi:hypothetical protein F2Q69_00009364 [Brassica cretica]|uniref:Uncharacterized protein n=2 Tax=Brassica cretica TaxID=69181 RepID=A0ABQ7CBP2_BRACR|nr:hypothetical protein F2Q69_00009364 [Brassica cretica]KAF3549395.1 hypothetical protein DY000_02009781 [Brassica cretica]
MAFVLRSLSLRLLDDKVIAHAKQVFPRVKEKCSTKHWFLAENINCLEELIGRLRRLEENVGIIANHVTAIQAGLDSWQAKQSSFTFISHNQSFWMNVGGVPWTGQNKPKLGDVFRNFMYICLIMLAVVYSKINKKPPTLSTMLNPGLDT